MPSKEIILWEAALLLGSYLIGAVPFGYLLGKLVKGIDIRKEGSGNIGATNVTRVLGKWWGKLCFLLDFLKGGLPVMIAMWMIARQIVPDPVGIFPSLTAFAAVCGHIFPVYLGFRGGKGVSTAAGAIFALNPLVLLGAGGVWVFLFFATRYVSLASILAALSLPIFCILFNHLIPSEYWRSASRPELILFCLLAILTVVKHLSNIKRLLSGTESRFEKKPKQEEH